MMRLFKQIHQHIYKRLSTKILACVKLDLGKAVSGFENINEVLLELAPDDNELESWMEETLAPI